MPSLTNCLDLWGLGPSPPPAPPPPILDFATFRAFVELRDLSRGIKLRIASPRAKGNKEIKITRKRSRGKDATEPSSAAGSPSPPRGGPDARGTDGPTWGGGGGGGVSAPMASRASGGRAGKHQRLHGARSARSCRPGAVIGPAHHVAGPGRASPARVTLYLRAPRRWAPPEVPWLHPRRALGPRGPTPTPRSRRRPSGRTEAKSAGAPPLSTRTGWHASLRPQLETFSVLMSGEGSFPGMGTEVGRQIHALLASRSMTPVFFSNLRRSGIGRLDLACARSPAFGTWMV